MGSRLIFLHRCQMRWGDGSWKVVRVLDVPVPVSQVSSRQIRWAYAEEMGRVNVMFAKQLEGVPGKASKLQSDTTVP